LSTSTHSSGAPRCLEERIVEQDLPCDDVEPPLAQNRNEGTQIEPAGGRTELDGEGDRAVVGHLAVHVLDVDHHGVDLPRLAGGEEPLDDVALRERVRGEINPDPAVAVRIAGRRIALSSRVGRIERDDECGEEDGEAAQGSGSGHFPRRVFDSTASQRRKGAQIGGRRTRFGWTVSRGVASPECHTVFILASRRIGRLKTAEGNGLRWSV